MTETPKKTSKNINQQALIRSKTDSKAVLVDQIDFSFRDLMVLEGLFLFCFQILVLFF